MIYDNITEDEKIKDIRTKVDKHSEKINNIVNDIINPYCKDLDKYIRFITDCLKDGQNPPTDYELEDFVLNLSTYVYWSGSSVEQLGIKDDISKAVYKEIYHTNRSNAKGGTVADKDSLAELSSQAEQLVNVCYNRAYRIMRGKVENAQELLSSCKKVLTKRISDIELTRTGGN